MNANVAPISIVIPAYGSADLVERCLKALSLELNARGAIDETIVVDDGSPRVAPNAGPNPGPSPLVDADGDARAAGKPGALARELSAAFPRVRFVTRRANGGFARALADGIAAAKHALVFALNSDVVVRVGTLAPLAAALEDPTVFAAVPRVLLDGDERRVESWVEFVPEAGRVRFDQPCLTRRARAPREDRDVAFPVGGACLLRKREFAALGGFDPLFEPFYFEDADLGLAAWRAGQRTRLVVAAAVEHRHRGTIMKVVGEKPAGERLVHAAIGRNAWLLEWKHSTLEELRAHVAALERAATDAWFAEDRERLVALALALERAEQALVAPRPAPEASLRGLAPRWVGARRSSAS